MDYEISVYGDSIAYGYGSNNKSWFDNLIIFNNKIKNAQNGETTSAVLEKLIKDTNTYNIIIIAVGVNDLLQESRKAEDFVNIKLMAQYNQIIAIAKTKADKVIIQSVLPVIEKRFPNQSWLDTPQYAFNKTIETFNRMLQYLAKEHSITYLDIYEIFKTKELEKIYTDAVHLNSEGQKELQNIYQNYFNENRFIN